MDNGGANKQTIFFVQNQFMCSSMMAIEGGAIVQLKYETSNRRVGCSTQDKINYLACYADNSIPFKYKVGFDEISHILGLEEEKLIIMPYSKVVDIMNVNFEASPGIVAKNLDFKDKAEVLQLEYF